MSQNIKDCKTNRKLYHEGNGELESEISCKTNPSRDKNPKKHLSERLTPTTTISITMITLSYITKRKKHLMYMDDDFKLQRYKVTEKEKKTSCIWMMTLNYKCTKSQKKKKHPMYMDDDFKLQ